MAKSQAVLRTNLGLFFNRPAIDIPLGGLQDGNNFRISGGRYTNAGIGWVDPGIATLNGPVMLIDRFRTRTIGDKTVFATLKDLYHYSGTTTTYITPRYATGTVEVTGGAPTTVTGTGTLWNSGDPKNVKAGDFIHFGNAAQNSISAEWNEILSVNSDTSLTLVSSHGVVAAGTAYTIRKVFTGSRDDVWEAEPFISGPSNTDWFYFTNGQDPVTRWDGSATASVYSGIYASGVTAAKTLSVYQNMMVYGNVVQGGASKTADIVNSKPGDPEDITTGLADQFKVHDSAGAIKKMLPIGDSLIIYSTSTIVAASFVGDPIVFVFRKVVNDTGPFNSRLILDFGDYHQFIANDGMYKFDGASLLVHGDHLWQPLLRNFDPSRTYQGVTLIVDEHAEAYWATALTTDNTEAPAVAFTEHYLEDPKDQYPAFGKRDFPFCSAGYHTLGSTLTWDNVVGIWDDNSSEWDSNANVQNFPIILCGQDNGKVMQLNNSQAQAGVAADSFIKFGRRASVDGKQRALIWRLYPFASDETGTAEALDVYVHLADHAHGDAMQTGPYPYDLSQGEDDHFVTVRRRGRFFEAEFRMDDSVTGGWAIGGYDWDGRAGGYR